ncbi:hypothetical protein ACRAWF_31985, partial [Streptomyces sp. L7]
MTGPAAAAARLCSAARDDFTLFVSVSSSGSYLAQMVAPSLPVEHDSLPETALSDEDVSDEVALT